VNHEPEEGFLNMNRCVRALVLVRTRAYSEYSFWTSSGFSICFHLSLSASPILLRREEGGKGNSRIA
jgi:hypothetical protein